MQLNSWDLLNDLRRTYSFHANRRWDTGHIDRIKNGSDVHKSTPMNFTLLRNFQKIFFRILKIFFIAGWRGDGDWREHGDGARAAGAVRAGHQREPGGDCVARDRLRYWGDDGDLSSWPGYTPYLTLHTLTLPLLTITNNPPLEQSSGVELLLLWSSGTILYNILYCTSVPCTIPRTTTVNCTMLYRHLHIFVYANTRS